MKYIVFLFTMLVGVPIGYYFAKASPKFRKLLFFLTIFFTCYAVHINFVSMEWYRGTSRGFEILLLDIFNLVLFCWLISQRKQRKLSLPPGSWIYFIYFFFSALSITNSDVLVYSGFELWKMMRIYLFFWTMYNYIETREQVHDFIKYASVTILFIFAFILKQKYIDHQFQTMGPFPHQNSLVMYMNVFTPIVFSYLLSVMDLVHLGYWLVVFGAGMVSIISTLSRAGMLMGGMGLGLVLMMNLSFKPDFRKVMIALIMLLMMTGFLLKAKDTIMERFLTAPEESANVRVMLAKAAVNMANDKVLGIGLNNFGHKINPPYPYSAHIDFKEDEQGGLVETVYLMIAAETGWHNLAVYLLMLLYFYVRNIINLFKTKDHLMKMVCIGIFSGLTAIYLESTLEWVLKQNNNFYQLMFIFALIGAISMKVIPRERGKSWTVTPSSTTSK